MVECVADGVEEFEVELLRDGVTAVEVSDGGGERIDASLGDELPGALRSGKRLADLVVADVLGVDVGAAPK
jgi:hypothetical protein